MARRRKFSVTTFIHRRQRGPALDVLLAMAPLTAMAVYVHHADAAGLLAACVAAAVAVSWATAEYTGGPVRPLHAAACGLLVALSLPHETDLSAACVAVVLGVGLGRLAFGGATSIALPALVAHVIAVAGTGLFGPFGAPPEAAWVATGAATPLAQAAASPQWSPLAWLLVGPQDGLLGDVSVPLALAGGLWLCARKRAPWTVPVGLVGAVWCLSGASNFALPVLPNALADLTTGGLVFFAAVAGLHDRSLPQTWRGQLAFALAAGAAIWLLRRLGDQSSGAAMAILAVALAAQWIRYRRQRALVSTPSLEQPVAH